MKLHCLKTVWYCWRLPEGEHVTGDTIYCNNTTLNKEIWRLNCLALYVLPDTEPHNDAQKICQQWPCCWRGLHFLTNSCGAGHTEPTRHTAVWVAPGPGCLSAGAKGWPMGCCSRSFHLPQGVQWWRTTNRRPYVC